MKLKMTEKLVQKWNKSSKSLTNWIDKLDNIESKIENVGRRVAEIEKSV